MRPHKNIWHAHNAVHAEVCQNIPPHIAKENSLHLHEKKLQCAPFPKITLSNQTLSSCCSTHANTSIRDVVHSMYPAYFWTKTESFDPPHPQFPHQKMCAQFQDCAHFFKLRVGMRAFTQMARAHCCGMGVTHGARQPEMHVVNGYCMQGP